MWVITQANSNYDVQLTKRDFRPGYGEYRDEFGLSSSLWMQIV